MRVLWFFQWVAHLPQNKPDLWLPIGAFPMGIWELQHRRPPKGGIYQQICARGIQRSPANNLICFCVLLSGLPLMCAVLTELMIFEIEHETNKKARKQGTLLPCSPNFGSSVSSLTILLYSIYRLSTVCFCGSPPPELGAGL